MTLADGTIVTLPDDQAGPINEALGRVSAGFTLENFLALTGPQDPNNFQDPVPLWRDIMTTIASEPDRQRRAELIIHTITAIHDSDFTDEADAILAEATMFLGSFIIEAGGSPEAVQQIENTWAALDIYYTSRADADASNDLTFVQAYMQASGLTREAAEVELTRFATVAGSRLLQDGVPMDEFNEIMSEFYFDDPLVSSGTQLMLGMIYGNPGGTPPLPGLAPTDQMRLDFEALMSNASSPTFAVDYAAFMNHHVVNYIATNRSLFGPNGELIDTLLTDAQMATVNSYSFTNPDATLLQAATSEASANAIPELIAENGTEVTPQDNLATQGVDESTMADEIYESWEIWTAMPHKINEVIEQFLNFTEPQRSTALNMNPDGVGPTIRDRITAISATHPELAPVLAAPVVPSTSSTPPVDPTIPAVIPPSATYAADLLVPLRMAYPTSNDSALGMSDIFTSRAQPYNNVDGIYEDIILAVLQTQSYDQARAALSSHLSGDIQGYDANGNPIPSKLDQVMGWLYPDGVTLNPQAAGAVSGLLAANPDLATIYQTQGILSASGVTMAPMTTDVTTSYVPSALTPDTGMVVG